MGKCASAITVYFGLSKGEGAWPSGHILSDGERRDPRSFCTFNLCFDDGLEGGALLSDIENCTVIYDGIAPIEVADDEWFGLRVKNGKLEGRIRPIIRFDLARHIEDDEFRRCVWGSSYCVKPIKAVEPFYAEDWNGYTEVLSPQREKEWIELLKENRIFSGKILPAQQLIEGVTAVQMQAGG